MKKVNVLCAFGAYTNNALLVLDTNIDDSIAIKNIFNKIKENELNDIELDEDELIELDDELKGVAKEVWETNQVYLDRRFEVTYCLIKNVEYYGNN
jgi:hypothetical protein